MSDQEIIISKLDALSASGGFGLIPGRSVYWNNVANEAEGFKDLAVTDTKTAKKATLVLKIMSEHARELDDERKRYTRPIDELKTAIIDVFSGSHARIVFSKDALNKSLTAYMKAEKARLDLLAAAEAERTRRAAEALAAAARSEGDESGAQEIESMADKTDSQRVVVRDAYGDTASIRETVRGNVQGGEMKREFLAWAAKNLSIDDLEQVTIGQRVLNRIAKYARDNGKSVPGLDITVDDKARVA